MRIHLYPGKILESDFKYAIINSLLKFLFIAGIAILVFILTSRTYVPASGMNNGYERIPQSVDASPPPPFSYESSLKDG